MRTGLIGFGLVELARGVTPAIAPWVGVSSHSRSRARMALERTERTTFDLPLGLALLTAVQRRSWRAPLLAVGSLTWTLRAVRQIAGERRTTGHCHELLRRMKPALGAGMLGWLFSRAARAERWATR